jgi:hypothetical protein
MGSSVSIDGLADAIMEGLQEYADMATDEMKAAVKKAAKTVKKDIQAGAPVKSGAYSKSWATKTMKDSSVALEVVVHSKNRYQLAHLLEKGHAKRGGGRVGGRAHIDPAEQHGMEQLEQDIERALRG